MAAPMKHIFRFSKHFSSPRGVLRLSNTCKIQYGIISCNFCSNSNDSLGAKNGTKLDLAKPKNRRKEREERRQEAESARELGLDGDLVKAAESVAESLGGDVKQTRSDLLRQLQEHAVKANAEEPQQTQTSSSKTMSMGDLLSGMKLEKPTTARRRGVPGRRKSAESTASSLDDEEMPFKQDETSRRMAQREFQQSREERPRTVEEIFRGPRLNIFNTGDEVDSKRKSALAETPTNRLFDESDAADLHRLSSTPASNAFEEMVQWTKEGKLWHFPIDNEQGWDEEKKVGFHEHVFLDHYLADFPQTPVIQHFMELVTTGLSMNPYLTVEMKKEHINWMKEYITSKMHLVEEGSSTTSAENQS